MEIPVHNRYKNYNHSHCFQKQIRIDNLKEDIKEAALSNEEVGNLSVRDFDFHFVPSSDSDMREKCDLFIKRHEWLGTIPNRVTHRFAATYKNNIAGVIMMGTPNAFSHVLGEENKNREKLISRGACISWSPLNLASALLMDSIRWMLQNTPYRVFSAYSDPEALELGTIYQSCNFIYTGQKYGADKLYLDPACPEKGWFSSRRFRHRSLYRRYAKNLGITWRSEWQDEKDRILWSVMPRHIESALRKAARGYQARCLVRKPSLKHKYLFIGGKDRREQKVLLKKFLSINPSMYNHETGKIGLPYPKQRGNSEA